MEVWNGNWNPSDEKAVALWDSLLRSGRKITALACSDTHRDSPGRPTTVVRAESTRQEDLLKAIQAGRVYLERDPHDGDLTFEAVPLNSKGKQIFGIGDTAELPGPGDLQLHALLSPPPGSGATVSLLTADGTVFSQKFAGDAHTVVHFDKSGYIRVEIRDAQGNMLIMSNPIFVNVQSRHPDSH